MIPLILIIIIATITVVIPSILLIKKALLFRYDKQNPYRRYCKKCGACQIQYESNVIGHNDTWWQEVYPIGNDEKCKCHSYSEYHD